jgi:hypothetical protein
VPLTRALHDGESWQWNEFRCTSFFFPSQTLYHAALLAEGRGHRVLFTGDGLGPGLWVSDYCCHNRNFTGEDEGLLFCLRRVEELAPDLLYDGHNDRPFAWTSEQLHFRRDALRRRARLLGEMSAREHPDYLTDSYWARAFPYSQETRPGLQVRLDIRFTSHAAIPAKASAAPVLPAGWRLVKASCKLQTLVPARAEGGAQCEIQLPPDAVAGQYLLPVKVTWNGRYLGQIVESRIEVF